MRALLTLLLLPLAGCTSDPSTSREQALQVTEAQAALGSDRAAFELVFHRDYLGGDRAAAVAQFREMAESGNVHAASLLGQVVYQMDDRGAERDLPEAALWLRIAANLGDDRAAEALAHYDDWRASGASPEATTSPDPADTPEAR